MTWELSHFPQGGKSHRTGLQCVILLLPPITWAFKHGNKFSQCSSNKVWSWSLLSQSQNRLHGFPSHHLFFFLSWHYLKFSSFLFSNIIETWEEGNVPFLLGRWEDWNSLNRKQNLRAAASQCTQPRSLSTLSTTAFPSALRKTGWVSVFTETMFLQD